MIGKSFVWFGRIWTQSIRLHWATILCREPTCQTSTNSVMARKMYTTCESIWRQSLILTLLWLQICQKKCASTAQENHPPDSPQQAAHWQSVKETRVRSSTNYMTCKQTTNTKEQRMIIGERKRNSIWREKRSAKAWSTFKNRSAKKGKKSAKSRITCSVNGNASKWISKGKCCTEHWNKWSSKEWYPIRHNRFN